MTPPPPLFSELLPSLAFNLTRSQDSRQSGSPWGPLSKASFCVWGPLLAPQTPRPPSLENKAGGRAKVSHPHNQPLNLTPGLPFVMKPWASSYGATPWPPYKLSQILGGCYLPRHTQDKARCRTLTTVLPRKYTLLQPRGRRFSNSEGGYDMVRRPAGRQATKLGILTLLGWKDSLEKRMATHSSILA